MTEPRQSLIVVDFDHTLFNTTAYVESLKARFKHDFDIESDDFMAARNAVKECCTVIDIDTFVEKLQPDSVALHQVLIDQTAKVASTLLFSDVWPFLHRVTKQYTVRVLTHGDQELQQVKISNSRLPDDLPITITRGNKADIIHSWKDAYATICVVDDKPAVIEQIKRAVPSVVTYLLVRPEDHPYADQKMTCDCADYVVRTLADVPEENKYSISDE